jgi:hypothetical protein
MRSLPRDNDPVARVREASSTAGRAGTDVHNQEVGQPDGLERVESGQSKAVVHMTLIQLYTRLNKKR